MKKLHQALVLIAIYALALGIRVYWFSQKDGLHVDEGLTIAIACCNDFMVTNNYEYGKKYTGKELKEASLVSSAGLKDALADIRSLWKDNRDPPHTNLYYTFLRLSLAGIKTGDAAPIILRGGILNLLFFTVSFVFFFLLTRLLFSGSEPLQYAAVFCAFLSTASISNTLFLRPYQIQETLFIMFCYYFVLGIEWKKYIIHENKLFVSVKPIALMTLLTALTLMSGYYALLFIGLFGLYAVYLQCKNKTFTEIPYYFVVLCLGVLLARILYPKYISGFFSYRGKEVIRTLSGNMTGNIRSSITSALTVLQEHFFSYPVIAVCVLCLAYIVFMLIRGQKLTAFVQELRGKKLSAAQKTAWYIFAASVIYLFIVMIVAPYKILRYGMPVFPFFVILPAMLIDSIGARQRKIAACAMLLLCGCFAFNAARESKIENIFRGKQDAYVFTKDKDTPVYVINNGAWSLWKYANLIPYIHDEQAYYFIDWYKYLGEILRTGQGNADIPLPEAEGYSSIYLLIEYFPDFQQINDLIAENIQTVQGAIESEFEINTGEPESWFPYFKGKKIIMEKN
jgi:hypothetical protein